MATLNIEATEIPKGSLTQRATWWAMSVFELLTNSDEMREAIPDGAIFVVLPASDPELCDYNLAISRKRSGTKVYVEISEMDNGYQVVPHLPMILGVGSSYT